MNPIDFLEIVAGCVHEIELSHGIYVSLFLAGLFGGFSHCAIMCGPFVVSQTNTLEKTRGALLLPYHLGRMTTYALMAMVLASVVNLAFLFAPIRSFFIAPILMVSGLIFLTVAFPSLSKIFPWLGRVSIFVPYHWLQGLHQKLSEHRGPIGTYLMGILLGFMPCGLIVSALLAATTMEMPWQAGLAMVAFGLGTMPALLCVALGAQTLSSVHPRAMRIAKQGAMVFSGLWLFAIAGSLLMDGIR